MTTKKISKALIALSVLFTLSACEEKVRTVSYYVDNRDEAKEVLKKCHNESEKGYEVEGTLKENCRNALEAEREIIAEKMANKLAQDINSIRNN